MTYANTAFGQGMSATLVQFGAAFSSIINGGTYYQPRLVESYKDATGNLQAQEPIVKKDDVVSDSTSQDMVTLLEKVARQNIASAMRSGYRIGGKTGTAQIPRPAAEGGGYYETRFNGTYAGFVGGDKPEYVIVVRVNEPGIPGNAGYVAAAPLFRDISNMLLDNFGVTPKDE